MRNGSCGITQRDSATKSTTDKPVDGSEQAGASPFRLFAVEEDLVPNESRIESRNCARAAGDGFIDSALI
jgi:hypothetical protein